MSVYARDGGGLASAASSDACGGGAAEAAQKETSNTHFIFAHKVFTLARGRFRMSTDGQTPCYYFLLGDMDASIPTSELRSQFDLTDGGEDSRLLDLIEDGLKLIKEIRPGDSIPTELLDGTASWSIEPEHQRRVELRLNMQLVSWLSGKEQIIRNAKMLEERLAQPEIKAKIREAFGEAAKALKLSEDQTDEVTDRVKRLGNEMAYVEALRDWCQKIRAIAMRMKEMRYIYRYERSVSEDLDRMQELMKRPADDVRRELEEYEAHTGQILNMLKTFDQHIHYIRKTRDRLRETNLLWGELVDEWNHLPLEMSEDAEALFKLTYQLLARHYPLVQRWSSSIY